MSTVTVTNLSTTTTKESLEKFLGFCGKVVDIQFEETKATVTFEKEKSAKTAEFLNGGTLDGATISIVGPTGGSTSEDPTSPTTNEHSDDDLGQHHKPRTAIAAEYLAHGYILGDNVIQQSIALDKKHGISKRFLSYFDNIVSKVKPVVQPGVDQAKAIDEKNKISQQVGTNINNAWNMSYQYYQKALASSYGQKVHAFYTDTSKTVLDVHDEAKRIAEAKKAHAHPSTSTSTTTSTTTSTSDPVPDPHPTAAPSAPGV